MLPILVTAGTFLWAKSGRLTRAERLIAYLSALATASCLLSMLVPSSSSDFPDAASSGVEWSLALFPWVGSAAGVALIWRNARTGVPDAASAIAAMEIVYVIVAGDCLITYASEGQVGAYLVAVTTLAYIAQIVAVAAAAPGHTAPAPQ
jgi:sorbitol-specific phosphotransferase system component IIC